MMSRTTRTMTRTEYSPKNSARQPGLGQRSMGKKQDLEDRLTRAFSWMEAARSLPANQTHMSFVSLYIAFNALYGQRRYEGKEDEARSDRVEFLERLYVLHTHDMRFGQGILLKGLKACRQPGGALIRNTFLRDSYWNKTEKAKELRNVFAHVAAKAEARLERGQYEEFLKLVLQRLTVLRNHVIHGCTTYGPRSKGLATLEDGLAVLKELVPAFCLLMAQYGSHVVWPPIPYPRTGSERHIATDQWTE